MHTNFKIYRVGASAHCFAVDIYSETEIAGPTGRLRNQASMEKGQP